VEVTDSLKAIGSEYDAVIVATPNGLHHGPAIEAAGLGKHVLTEKPLDITCANMEAMIEACSRAGVKLGVAYQHRMSPDNRKVKELIDNGLFGRILAADFTVYCWRDQAYYDSGAWRGGWEIDGGGPFMQQACHQVDLYTWFFGSPETVYGLTDRFIHEIEVEDHGAALLRHSNGMIGTFIASTIAYPGFDPVLTIITEKGTLIMQNGMITGWHIDGIDNPSRTPEAILHSGAASAAVTETGLHEEIIADFVAAVRNDRDPAVTGDSARAATELILRIYGKL
jgi:predicted dehydrogenase